MAQIREYQQQVGGASELPLAQVTRQAFASDFSGAADGAVIAGQSVQQAAADAVSIQRMIEDQKARSEVTDAAVELARFNSSAAHELKNAENTGAFDNDSYTEEYMARINTNLDLVGSRFETTAGRQAWTRGAAEMSGHYLIAAGNAQSRAAGIKAVSQYRDFVDATRNTVMNDPFQFSRLEQGAANVINDPNGVFAHIPADQRDELARTTKTELAKSAVQGVIRLDPRIALNQLTGDQWDPYLDADAKHALQNEARVGIAGLDAEARRQEAEAERQRKREIEQTNQQMVDLYTSKSLTTRQILDSNLNATGEGSKEHWIKMIEAQNKEHREAPIKKDPRLFVQTLEGIRKGTITSETQIENLFAQSADRGTGVTWEDTKQLRQELMDLRTPEGERLSKQLDSFMASRKPSIDKSNPLMGKIDRTGSAKFYDFEQMVRSKIDEYKKAGKDPRALLNPNSPEFLGAPSIVNQFRPTIQETAQAMSEDLSRGMKPPEAKAPSKTPGIFEWFKRGEPEKKPVPQAQPQSSPVPKDSTEQMRNAVSDLEKAVRTMPGTAPAPVEPRKAGETAAQFFRPME